MPRSSLDFIEQDSDDSKTDEEEEESISNCPSPTYWEDEWIICLVNLHSDDPSTSSAQSRDEGGFIWYHTTPHQTVM